MKDVTKTKEQLINELADLRQRIAELEASASDQIAMAIENARLYEAVQQELTERKRVEEQLRFQAQLLDSVRESVVGTDLKGHVIYWSKGAEVLYGYSAEEVMGKSITFIVRPEDKQAQEQRIRQIRETGLWSGQHVQQCKDGSLFWADTVISLVTDQNGRPFGLIGIDRDITESKRAEEALRRSEERFRQVTSSISDHIYMTEVTEDGNYVNLYISPHVEALTGYPWEKVMADWHFWSSALIHPDDRAAAAAQAMSLAKGQNSEMEYRMVRADSEVIWVRDSARVESEGASKIIYGVVSNITERKRAEEEIRKLNEELEQRVADRTRELSALYEVSAVASESPDLQTTLERSLERVLAAMQSKVGAIHLLDEAGEGLYLAVQQGVPPDVATQIEPPPGNGLADWVLGPGEPLLVPDLAADPRAPQAAHASGLHTYVGAPIRARGRALGVLSVFGEVDQQFNVEDVALLASIADQVGVAVENARLRQRANQAAIIEERGRLARELHDSVTQSLYSLTLLAGGGRRLARAGNLENVADYLTDLEEIAQQALGEMRLLVYQLRPAALEREGLVGALQQRMDAVEGRAGVEARLLVEETVTLPAPVEEGLYRITVEALNNTLKHATASSVTVQIAADGQLVELEVTDNGKGFDVDAARDTGGMGLVSMRERAEKLGGSLIVLSAPGKGTKVKVSVRIGQNR